MPKKEPKPASMFAVHSQNTGALICGPYTAKKDADRECRRLNKEAATGVQAATGEPINYLDVFHCAECQTAIVPHPKIGSHHCPHCFEEKGGLEGTGAEAFDPVGWVSVRQIPQRVLHEGVPQGYEVRSRSAEGVEVVLG